MVVHKKAMKVRPKFFQLVTGGIPRNLCSPNIDIAAERPGAGMICIGNCRGHAITEKFREVELSFSQVRARKQNPCAGVPGPVEEPACSHLVEARVLMQHSGKSRAGHKVSDRVVGIR